MTEFILHTHETAPEGSRDALAAVARAWGFTPKLHATLAESPTALDAYEALFALVGKSTLTPAEQQAAFLIVSVFHGCAYCTMGHTYLGRSAGLDEAALAALRAGEAPKDARLDALWTFTRAVLENRGRAGDAAVDAFLAAGFSRANILEILTVIAAKTISNYADHLAHVPQEDFMSDPALAWSAPAAG